MVGLPLAGDGLASAYVAVHRAAPAASSEKRGDRRRSWPPPGDLGTGHDATDPACGHGQDRGANVAHHGFAPVASRSRRVDVRQAQRLVADLEREVGDHETVILSSEVIYRLPGGAGQWNRMGPRTYWRARLAYLDRLATLLGDFRVEVVLFFRRPDTFAEALYSEDVLNTLDQSDFRRWREERGPLFDYAGQIEAFRTVFPSVTALDYDDARRTGLVRAFSDVVGVRVADPGAWNRRSPDGRVILWMQQRRPGTRKQRYDFAASGELESAHVAVASCCRRRAHRRRRSRNPATASATAPISSTAHTTPNHGTAASASTAPPATRASARSGSAGPTSPTTRKARSPVAGWPSRSSWPPG